MATSFRVHTSGRFVKENDFWASKQCNSNLKLTLVSSREVARQFRIVVGQVKLFNGIFNNLLSVIFRNTLDLSIKLKMLLHSHQREESILLWAVSHSLYTFAEIFDNVTTVDLTVSTRGNDITCQTLKHSRLSSTVDTEKRETFSNVNTKGDSLDCQVRLCEQSRVGQAKVIYTDQILLVTSLSLLVKQRSRISVRVIVLVFILLCNSLFFSNDIIVKIEVASGIGHESDREICTAAQKS